MRRIVASTVVAVVMTSAVAGAQVPTRVEWPGDSQFCKSAKSVADLSKEYYAGDWDDLQKDLKALMAGQESCHFSDAPNLKQDYVLVAFVATEPKPDPEVVHVLLHGSTLPPFTMSLPGVGTKGAAAKLWLLFLADDPNVDVATLMTSTSTPNPLVAQIGDLAQKFDLSKFFPAARATLRIAASQDKGLYARIAQVTLPYARGTIAQADYVNLPAETLLGTQADKIKKKANAIFADVNASVAIQRTCTTNVNQQIHGALANVAESQPWAGLPALINDAVTRATASGCTSADFDEVQAVVNQYRSLVSDPKPTAVTGSASWTNQPLSTIDFTVGAGVLVGALHGAAKTTLTDDGAYKAADPLERGMTWAGVTLHAPYDATLPSPSARERVGVLIGGVLTPAGGICTGLSIVLVRGFSVNAGMAWLFVPSRPSDKQNGEQPADKNKPFDTGFAHGIFIGGNFTFK
jgi:hypothetical protein